MSNPETFSAVPSPPPPPSPRRWIWIVLSVFLVLFLLCAGICAGIVWSVLAMMRSSEPYVMSFQRVKDSPEVRQRIGEPVEPVTWPPPTLHVDNDRGSAVGTYRVEGPKGQAVVRIEGRKMAGVWEINVLEVTFANGERISLDAPADESNDAPPFEVGGEAPKFQPEADPKIDVDQPGDIKIELPKLE